MKEQSTVGQPILETLSDWEGDVEDLARLGENWCAMLRIEDRPVITVRLVRDYTQRGILGRPRREAKVAIYGWEHLVRLLAARLLLRDGWPLQKISDEFAVRSSAEIRYLLPGANRADVAMSYRHDDQKRSDPALDALRMMRSRSVQRLSEAPSQSAAVPPAGRMPPISEHTVRKQEFAASRRALGESSEDPPSHTYTRIEIATGVELHIETTRLRMLGRSDAMEISRAVYASLLNPRYRKEDKLK